MIKELHPMKNNEMKIIWDFIHDVDESVSASLFALNSDRVNEALNLLRKTDEQFTDDSNPIKVAIAGRMKAGKSMLADVLFFGGDGVLNSDTTPATANITYIHYADEEHQEGAEITFLNQSEVMEMENYLTRQSEDGESDDDNLVDSLRLKATRERLGSINRDPGKKAALLGKTRQVSLADLKAYSDTGGEFADYVNQIDVYIKDPRLKDLTIVDTPGLGDPVVSRGQKARDEYRTSNVVFYLSAAGHFMDMVDAQEYTNMKRAGCENIVVIMSRFDEVFEADSEEPEDGGFADTLTFIQLADAGCKRIKAALEGAGLRYEPMPVIPVCALGAKLAGHTLETDDGFYRNRLSDLFRDWSDKEAVYRLSGMKDIGEEVERVRSGKKQIWEQSRKSAFDACRLQADALYNSLKSRIENEIKIRQKLLSNPEEAQKAGSELASFGNSVKSRLNNCLSQIRSDFINTECAKLTREIQLRAREAKSGIDDGRTPEAINGSYELVFKNSVEDLFIDGIKSRMRFEKENAAFGRLFEFFREQLRTVPVPMAISSTGGLLNYVLNPLFDLFEAEIRNHFEAAISKGLPYSNVHKVLSDSYYTVRLWSPDFKFKANPGKGRSQKNSDAKSRCKGAIDEAVKKLIDAVDFFSATSMGDLFDGIKKALINSLDISLDEMSLRIAQRDAKTVQAEISMMDEILRKVTALSAVTANVPVKDGEAL